MFCSVQAIASDRWLQLNFSDSNPVMYLDLQTLKTNKYWVKFVYKTPQKIGDKTFNSTISEHNYSCTSNSSSIATSHLYYDTQSASKFIKSINFENPMSKMESVVPNSMGESILNKACLFTNQI